jgi:hypothetical protein
VWRVGRNIDGFAGSGDEILITEAQLDFAFEDGEHLLEIVTVRRGPAAGWDVHVDECVLAGCVVTGHQDRVGVSDNAEMRKIVVLVRSSDGEVSLKVVGRYRLRRRGG